MITHDGFVIPVFPQRWDPFDKAWVWFAWDGLLDGAAVTSSAWVIPSGWTQSQTQMAQPVTDEYGAAYTAANGVLLSNPSATAGLSVTVTNQVVLSDGRQYERSVVLVVGNQ